MNTHIQGLHTTLTPAIEEYTQKRISSLSKFIRYENAVCNVELIKTTGHHRSGDIFKAEANIHMGDGEDVYAVAEREDLYQAVDALRDELERILTSMKEKKITLFRRGAARVKDIMKGLRPWKK
jgi:ribosomal subunit interface protein